MQSIARLLWIGVASAGAGGVAASGCGRVNFEPSGDGGAPGQAVVPPIVEFEARCGAGGGVGFVELENAGDVELALTAASTTGGFVFVTALPLVILGGERVQLEVRAPAAVIGADRPGNMKAGTLLLTIGESSHSVMLVANVIGADFVITDTTGQQISFDLTGTSGVCPTPLPTRLQNIGGVAANVMLSATSGIAFSGFSGGTLESGEKVDFTVRPLTAGPCSGAETISYVATGEVCDTLPTVLQATFVISGSSTCACS